MPDLSIDFCGIKSPNPFWLASAPPTNSGIQIMRAFDLGWGGAVWKTLGKPIINVSSRLGLLKRHNNKILGLNNIELITDRSLDINFKEIYEVKKRFAKNTLIVSLMVETKKEWKDIIQRSQDSGADGLELNFGCPHGMCENGMGSAVGEEPKILKRITSWVSEMSTLPVIIKLTPNVTDINITAKAGIEGGANGISIINTVKSIIGVNLDKMIPEPVVGNFSTNGGYCGPAVKPIALYMLAQLAKNPKIKIPISGIGGISNWYDAAEFISLGATSVQVCTAVMNYGYRIILDMLDGLNNFLIDKKFKSLNSLFGRAIPLLKSWKDLNLKYRVVASIDPKSCVGCNLCYIACLDGGHQSILLPDIKKNDIHKTGHSVEAFNFVFNQNKGNSSIPIIYEPDCVGCNLCKYVCPIEDCITMEQR